MSLLSSGQQMRNSHILASSVSQQPPTEWRQPPPSATSDRPLSISEEEVRRLFQRQNPRKVPGSEEVSPCCLRVCEDQLALVFCQIFRRSLELCKVLSCLKRSSIIPCLKVSFTTGQNDYMVTKSFCDFVT